MLKNLPLWLLSLFLFMGLLSACTAFKKTRTSIQPNEHEPVGSSKKKVLVMLHGLWESAREFDTSIQRLKTAFEVQHMAVLVDTLEEESTSEISITAQAAKAFQTLQDRYPAADYEIILWGHSQGGVRGLALFNLNQQQGNALSIQGLITTGTPWEGAPVAALTKQKIKDYLRKSPFKYLFAGVKRFYPPSAQLDDAYIDDLFATYLPADHPGPGVKDLMPSSDFLKNVTAGLVDNALPILAIGGSNGDVRKILLASELPVQLNIAHAYIRMFPLNSAYRYIFAGGLMRDHDMLVPLSSQLASNTPKNNQFKSYIVQDAMHDFLPGLPINMDQVIYNHPTVIKQVVGFAKQQFTW